MKQGHLNNPASQRRLKEQEKLAVGQAKADLGAVLAMPEGRRFVWNLLGERAHVFSAVVSDEPMALARHAGMRLVGVELLRRAQEHPELFITMWSEAMAAARDAAVQRESAQAAPRPDEPGVAVTADVHTTIEEDDDA